MSRPWNSSLQLRVGAGRIEATCRRGWPSRAPDRHAQRDVAATAQPDAHAQAIEGVLDDIAAQGSLKGLRLDAVLSSALLHLDVVEGDFGDHADRQLQAIASACVDEMLDDEAAAHAVRWHLQGDARHLLIAAIPQVLLETLQAAAQRTGMRLRSVVPEFVVRWNRYGRIAAPGHWVFAVCTPGDLAVATVADGSLSSISIGPGMAPREGAAADAAAPAAPERVHLKPAGVLVNASSGGGHGVFTSTRPMPQAVVDALDARVDRLLYGSGQDPAAQARFVLVARDAREIAASARWSLASVGAAA